MSILIGPCLPHRSQATSETLGRAKHGHPWPASSPSGGGSRISTPSSPAAFSGRRKRFLSAGPLPAVDAEDPEEEVEEDAEVRVEEEIEEDAIVEATAGERVVPRKQGWRSGSRRRPAK